MTIRKHRLTGVALVAVFFLLTSCAGEEAVTSSTIQNVATTVAEPTTTTARVTTTQAPSCANPVNGTTPPGRGYSAMVGLGEEPGVILTGGETAPPPEGGEVLTDTWAFTGSGWANQTQCPSPPWGTADYDQESGRVILVGWTEEGWVDVEETWAFDPATGAWTQMAIEPAMDDVGQVAYDAESDRVIMFGERGATVAYDYNTDTWEEMQPSPSPPDRIEPAMVYDAGSDRVILFGGYRESPVGDTWTYDYNANIWTEMTPDPSPEPRAYPKMVYDPRLDLVLLYGGEGTSAFGDTWSYDVDTNTWNELDTPSSPGPLSWHSMAYDAGSGMVVLFGGAPSRPPEFRSDTWLYDPNAISWAQLP